MTITLYNSTQCPCPSAYSRRGHCRAYCDFHHGRGEPTYCEYLKTKQDGVPAVSDSVYRSGRQVRLMDYGPCAG